MQDPDEFDAQEAGNAPSAPAIHAPEKQSPLREQYTEAADAHRENAARESSNRMRERAALDITQLVWLGADGLGYPVRWTVACKNYYEAIMDAMGFDPTAIRPVKGESMSTHVFLWLATHDQDTWVLRSTQTGLALVDDFKLWGSIILEWAGEEFPFGPNHFDRIESATALRNETFRLCYTARAEVAEDLEPETEDKPGN